LTGSSEVPPATVEKLRAICLRLPEAFEEPAWVGTRWRVRTHTFAHVLTVATGWPPAYARALGRDGPVTVLTFESSGDELAALRAGAYPFFAPPWRATIVGLVLDADADTDAAELVTESYRVLAPTKLAALIESRDGPPQSP
jgi:hypothetical protein